MISYNVTNDKQFKMFLIKIVRQANINVYYVEL